MEFRIKKNTIKIAFVSTLFLIAACRNPVEFPGYQYMPDMYDAIGYEANSANPNFKDSITQQQPVAGTIARGNDIYSAMDRMPYPF